MRLILVCLLLWPFELLFAAALPDDVLVALKKLNIPAEAAHVVVQEVGQPQALINHNANERVNPASVMKLLTTFAGLEMLGPNYRWKTEVYLNGQLNNGVLDGDLVFKGYGNPKLTAGEFWLWMSELRQRGLREIRGDIVLDDSFFQIPPFDPGAFDNSPNKPYSQGANALLLNFNATQLIMTPQAGKINVVMLPELAGYQINNQLKVGKIACASDDFYQATVSGKQITLTGSIPPETCGDFYDALSFLNHHDYFYAVFQNVWSSLGGRLSGGMRVAVLPNQAELFSTHLSPPLIDIIRDINKQSNNVMARQLFLTLGGMDANSTSLASSSAAIQQWLLFSGMRFPELMIENGSGLSRDERVTARLLADILLFSAQRPLSAEYRSSLPILGVDGTLRKRLKDSNAQGSAHLKTGTLKGVKSIAGYVHGQDGRQWVLVFIINHANASTGGSAQDKLIEWVQQLR